MERIILHIDFDSFFASVAQQDTPSLRHKPIGVTATNGRSCIIAASREAKQFGIHTASRTFDAQQVCPGIIFVPANFVRYATVSKKFLRLCSDYSPFVEMFSIDEVFMDVTKTAHLFGGVDMLIEKIKQRLKQDVGEYITASFGVSYNKLLAKLASGLEKPNGLVKVTGENLDRVYAKADLSAVCGIGPRILRRLQLLGAYTLLQLRAIPLYILMAEFGPIEGHFLYNVGLGEDPSLVIPYTQDPGVKSVGRNYCLPRNEYNQRIILQHVYELCEEVSIKLRRLKKKAKIVSLSLRGTQTGHGSIRDSKFLDTGRELFARCYDLYKAWKWDESGYENSMVRQIAVYTADLHDSHSVPDYLFENNRRSDQLTKTIDALNDKFGDHTIRNGFLLYAQKLTTVPNGYGSDRFERMKLAST